VGSLFWGVTTSGCAIAPVRLSDADRAVEADEYDDQVVHWTRRAEQYEDFLSRIFVYATFRGWSFRQAQIAHRAETERLPDVDVARLRARELAESTAGHDFFMAVHTHDWAWNRLERTGDDAIWRLRLLNDQGDSVAPLEIQRLGTRDPRYTRLYPHYREFYVGYLVRFPRTTDDGREILRDGIGRFTVRIGGPQAVVDLKWEVVKEAP
jgi:hypothetical protein